jgi:hypothetical protein
MSTGRIDRALSSITTLAVIAMAAVVVYHEIVPQTVPARARSNDGQMVFYDGWAKVGKTGRSLGDSLAQIQLIEFSDLECPFCKAFHEETEPAFEKRFGGRVNVIFVHLPIRGHRFALMAAQGAECAAEQGEFSNFVHTAFANQDSFGLKPWWVLAQASGIKDSLVCVLQILSPCFSKFCHPEGLPVSFKLPRWDVRSRSPEARGGCSECLIVMRSRRWCVRRSRRARLPSS